MFQAFFENAVYKNSNFSFREVEAVGIKFSQHSGSFSRNFLSNNSFRCIQILPIFHWIAFNFECSNMIVRGRVLGWRLWIWSQVFSLFWARVTFIWFFQKKLFVPLPSFFLSTNKNLKKLQMGKNYLGQNFWYRSVIQKLCKKKVVVHLALANDALYSHLVKNWREGTSILHKF